MKILSVENLANFIPNYLDSQEMLILDYHEMS
jgi:hypothetical protein